MGLTTGHPSYTTVLSSGGTLSLSPWQLMDAYRNPMNVTFSVGAGAVVPSSATAGGVWLQFTVDDPFGYYPNPQSTPPPNLQGPSTNPFVIGYASSTLFGAFTNLVSGSSAAPILGLSLPFGGAITVPFTAWRIGISSSIGSAIATMLQSGPR